MPLSRFSFAACLLLLAAGWAGALLLHGPADIQFAFAVLPVFGFMALLAWHGLPRPDAPTMLLGAWWIYLAIGCLWSSAPFVSLLFLLLLLPLPAGAWLLSGLHPAQRRMLFRATLGGLAALAAATLVQFLLFDRTLGPRIHAPFLDPNCLAAAIDLGLLPALALFLAGRGGRLTGALPALFFAALLATQSRSGLLAAGVAALALLPFLRASPRHIVLAALGALAIAGAMEVFGRAVYGHGPALHLASRAPMNFTDRLSLWTTTWQMIVARPFAGTGLGTFSYWYPRFRSPRDFSDGFFAHDDFLQFWAEAGIAAPLLFAAFVVARFYRTARSPAELQALGGTTALLAIALQSLVTYVFYLPALLLPLGLLLASGGPETPTIYRPRGSRLACMVLLLAAACWVVRAEIGIVAVRRAADAEARGDLDAMGRAVALGERFAPADDFTVWQYAARWQHGRAGHLADADAPDKGLDAIARAERLNKGFAYLELTRAQLVADGQRIGDRTADNRQEELILEGLLKNDPLCLEARYALAEFYAADGNTHDALDTMGDGLNWPRPPGEEKNLLSTIGDLCAKTGDAACADQLRNFMSGVLQTR